MARLVFSTNRTRPRTRRRASSSIGRVTSTHHSSPASWSSSCSWALTDGMVGLAEQGGGDVLDLLAQPLEQ